VNSINDISHSLRLVDSTIRSRHGAQKNATEPLTVNDLLYAQTAWANLWEWGDMNLFCISPDDIRNGG